MPHDVMTRRVSLDHGTVGARNGRCQRRPRQPTRTERTYPFNDDHRTKFVPDVRPYQTHAHPLGEEVGGGSTRDGEGKHSAPEVDWEQRLFRPRPDNEYQALMEAAPHQEPETHAEQHLELREKVADAIDDLAPREREVFEGVFIRGESCAEIGRRLGFSRQHITRIRDAAKETLRVALQDEPVVVAYLESQIGAQSGQ